MTIQAFYSLTGTPFLKSIKTKDLFESESTRELHCRLEYMSNHCGLMMLTGEPGTGKTTALRKFADSLNPQRYKCFYIPLSTVNVMDFYRQLNRELCATPVYRKADLFRSIQEAIMDHTVNKKILPVIIFDEAHFLNRENLFELQLLTNFKMDSLDPALIILAGQTHLRDKIKLPAHNPLYQRFHLKYHLTPLRKGEVGAYINHHLKIVGREEPLFTPAAIDSIYSRTNGHMRQVGDLTEKTMNVGWYQRKLSLTEEDVFNAGKEL